MVIMENLELGSKQVFDFMRYDFGVGELKVRPTIEHLRTLHLKIQKLLSKLTCPIRHLMSLIGLLTTTEKQVH